MDIKEQILTELSYVGLAISGGYSTPVLVSHLKNLYDASQEGWTRTGEFKDLHVKKDGISAFEAYCSWSKRILHELGFTSLRNTLEWNPGVYFVLSMVVQLGIEDEFMQEVKLSTAEKKSIQKPKETAKLHYTVTRSNGAAKQMVIDTNSTALQDIFEDTQKHYVTLTNKQLIYISKILGTTIRADRGMPEGVYAWERGAGKTTAEIIALINCSKQRSHEIGLVAESREVVEEFVDKLRKTIKTLNKDIQVLVEYRVEGFYIRLNGESLFNGYYDHYPESLLTNKDMCISL